jgi:hypothetical protein
MPFMSSHSSAHTRACTAEFVLEAVGYRALTFQLVEQAAQQRKSIEIIVPKF